jgi:hypothetical protein
VTRGNIIDDIDGVEDSDLMNGFEPDPRDTQHDLEQPIFSRLVRHVSFYINFIIQIL